MKKERGRVSKKMIKPDACVFCGGTVFSLLYSALDFDTGKISFQLTRCTSCNLVRTELMFNNNEMGNYYSMPYYGSGKAKFIGMTETLTRFFNHARASSILSHLHNHQESSERTAIKILDIGCGRGNLLNILKQMGCDCYGIERREFPIDDGFENIHIYKDRLESISFSEGFFDAVIIWHVLEHMDDPMLTIRETARILRTGGMLAVAVPNFGSFQARVFRESWFHLDLPRHAHHFAKDVLLECLRDNGFDIIRNHTFSIEQNLFGFIQSFFNKIVLFAKPNQFYSLLKKRQNLFSTLSFLLWAIFAILILPLALFEYLISGVLGRGATVMIYAKKY
jgi:2-polyprenyl-3-methyl-5-hydroxy-6-metoxy-1,4-benzoquinol methylase